VVLPLNPKTTFCNLLIVLHALGPASSVGALTTPCRVRARERSGSGRVLFPMEEKRRSRSRSRSRSRDRDSKHHRHHHSKHHHRHREEGARDRKHRSRSRDRSRDRSPAAPSSSSSSSSSSLPSGVQRLSADDFASRALEFRWWLWRRKGQTRLFDLPKTAAHSLFANEFVPAFNSGSLPSLVYGAGSVAGERALLDDLEGSGGSVRTGHAWGLKLSGADKEALVALTDTVLTATIKGEADGGGGATKGGLPQRRDGAGGGGGGGGGGGRGRGQ
jgi:hypothetical protein